jgi:pyridoxine 5-phosphate synthase
MHLGMTRLSVNINKVALLRNSRRGNYPDLYKFALDCERFGAQGITVHPRPDQRHIRFEDIPLLAAQIQTELNIEGYPTDQFLQMVIKNKAIQCTLVPDAANVLTSEEGWDVIKNHDKLRSICSQLREKGIRVSIFIDPLPEQAEAVASVGADCIELYTGSYAAAYAVGNGADEVQKHAATAEVAIQHGLMVNAGHDLNLDNLAFYKSNLPALDEVSIGHAIIADALYFGIDNAIKLYRQKLI